MLNPKHKPTKPLLGWNELDDLLQANFSKIIKEKSPSATINLNEYNLSFSEIEREAIKNGYKVENLGNDYVKFT